MLLEARSSQPAVTCCVPCDVSSLDHGGRGLAHGTPAYLLQCIDPGTLRARARVCVCIDVNATDTYAYTYACVHMYVYMYMVYGIHIYIYVCRCICMFGTAGWVDCL